MDFSLTDTQQMLQDSAGRLLRDRYDFETRKKFLAASEGSAPDVWRALAELGLMGIEIEERFGGSEGTFFDLVVVMEEIGRALVVEPFLPTVVLGAGLVQRFGSEAQKAAVLPKIAEGALKLALAHGETAARYELPHVETKAAKSGGGWRIDGAKSVVLGGDVADTFIVSARTAGGPTDRAGITLFLVPRDTPGLQVTPYRNVDGTRAAELAFDGVTVGADAVIGGEGEGLAAVEHAVERGIAALCWEALGAMAALNELTVDYLKTRVQFGRPIGKFQVLQHRMVDMTIAAEEARSMAILAADRIGTEDPALRSKEISAAKARVGKSARIVGRGAVQLHGGIGLTMEYAGSHYFKRLTAIDLTFGDVDHHLQRFAAAG